MQLTEFCAQNDITLAQKPVLLFTSKSYNPLSFERILMWLQKKSQNSNSSFLSLSKLDLDQDQSELAMKLHTTFLGQTFTFWFGDLSLISSKKKRSDWISFLSNYHGPHQIIGWLSQDDVVAHSSSVTLIDVPEIYTSDMVPKLAFLYEASKPEISAYFFGRLYRVRKEYTLEQLCLLQSYAGLVGKSIDVFFETWLEQLAISDISLFYIGQLFFEKRADLFFEQWHKVKEYYSDQFWIAFFSDQLFKAYFYVAAQGRIALEQKQMTYGLPFSFLKHDWKIYKVGQLQHFHQELYQIDLALKSGGNSYSLDLFFAKFFEK